MKGKANAAEIDERETILLIRNTIKNTPKVIPAANG